MSKEKISSRGVHISVCPVDDAIYLSVRGEDDREYAGCACTLGNAERILEDLFSAVSRLKLRLDRKVAEASARNSASPPEEPKA